MKSYSPAVILLGVVALAGCDMARGKHDVDAAAVEKQLKDIEGNWQAEYNARDVDALAAHYGGDAALANPGAAREHERHVGRRHRFVPPISSSNSERSGARRQYGDSLHPGALHDAVDRPEKKQPRRIAGASHRLQKQATEAGKRSRTSSPPALPPPGRNPADCANRAVGPTRSRREGALP